VAGWSEDDSIAWMHFFERLGPYAYADRAPFDLARLRPTAAAAPVADAIPAADTPALAEPLVCTTSEAASAWSAQRAKVRRSARKAAPGDVVKGKRFHFFRESDAVYSSSTILFFGRC
jgi:hypothetical protein